MTAIVGSFASSAVYGRWLECPVEETDERGRKTRTTEARDHRRGIPQGSPLSPLLAQERPERRRLISPASVSRAKAEAAVSRRPPHFTRATGRHQNSPFSI